MASISKASISSFDAAPPFDAFAQEADIILRSSDNVDFHFSKSVLAYSSPVFKNLFMDGRPKETKRRRLVVPLPDHSDQLLPFLLLLHPFHNITIIDSTRALLDLQRMIDKYCLIDASDRLYQLALSTPNVVSNTSPVELFATAIHIKSAPLAQLAAKRMLQIPSYKLLGEESYDAALGTAPARYVNQLMRYHQKCGEQSRTICSTGGSIDISWMSPTLYDILVHKSKTQSNMHEVQCADDGRKQFVRFPVKCFYDMVYQALETHPCAEAVRSTHAEIAALGQVLGIIDIMRLVDETCNEIDRRIAQVVLDIRF